VWGKQRLYDPGGRRSKNIEKQNGGEESRIIITKSPPTKQLWKKHRQARGMKGSGKETKDHFVHYRGGSPFTAKKKTSFGQTRGRPGCVGTEMWEQKGGETMNQKTRQVWLDTKASTQNDNHVGEKRVEAPVRSCEILS